MKCVTNGIEIRRVSESRANELVSKGWKFTNKEAWKASPNTTWVKASTPANPMSPAKVRRKEMRNAK